MYSKFNNILFIFLLFIILGFIGLFNYLVDPYKLIFDRDFKLHLSDYKKDMLGTVMKLSKKSQYDVLVIGGSTTNEFMKKSPIATTKKCAFLVYQAFPLEKILDYTVFFLKLHPEIKTVIYPIEYHSYYMYNHDDFPVIKSKNLTFQEIFRLFFSAETTKLSIKTFINNPKIIYKHITSEKDYFADFNKEYDMDLLFTNLVDYTYEMTYDFNPGLKKIADNSPPLEYLERVINILENGNFEVQYIVPPYHALLQTNIYKTLDYNEIENMKKLFVEKTNRPLRDFAYINKYTSQDIKTTSLYYDVVHPFGRNHNIFWCVLSDPERYKEQDMFIDITKDNLEYVLKHQRNLLEEYIRKNNDSINKFMKNTTSTYITKHVRQAPDCL